MAPRTCAVVALLFALVQVSFASSEYYEDSYGHTGGYSGYEGGSSEYEGDSSASTEAYSSGHSAEGFAASGAYSGYEGGKSSGHGGFVEGLCPGPVVEKQVVVNRAVQVPYTYTDTVQSRQCYSKHGSERSVAPTSYSTGEDCTTRTTTQQVPTTETTVEETPLCKKDCTVTDYIIQIPVRDVVCKNNPYCKRNVRVQQNVATTTTARTSCNKGLCNQNRVTVTPTVDTVCQTYQTTVPKVGTRTVNKEEVQVQRVQLPSQKCLKPAHKHYY